MSMAGDPRLLLLSSVGQELAPCPRVHNSGQKTSFCPTIKTGFPVTTARGKHLFPFRTEPLSPSAPMVLLPQGGGRVGRRRDFPLVPGRAHPPWTGTPRRSLSWPARRPTSLSSSCWARSSRWPTPRSTLADTAVSYVGEDDDEQLVCSFDAFEREEVGEGVHEKYHRWAHDLAERYQ